MSNPTPASDEWLLINAEERAKKYPREWRIPPASVRNKLKPGDRAKIGFEMIDIPNCRLAAEGVWVLVLGQGSYGEYHAEVLVPTIAVGIQQGEHVTFFGRHVLGVGRATVVTP